MVQKPVLLATITIPPEFAEQQKPLHPLRKLGLTLVVGGLIIVLVGSGGAFAAYASLYGYLSFGFISLGAIIYLLPLWLEHEFGVSDHGVMFRSAQHRGAPAWLLTLGMTGAYILLYWFPEYLQHVIHSVDALSYLLRGKAADHWFLYGTLYTFAVILMGIRMLLRHRTNPYQRWRTISVMSAQLWFAFFIPAVLQLFEQPEFYFTYFWPLKYYYLDPSFVRYQLSAGTLFPVIMVWWSMVMIIVVTPILTYFYGKRWYCSWVCGCGGLAETLGDPFRHNSSKTLLAWRVERYMVYGVLVAVVLMTGLLWWNSYHQGWVLGEFSITYARIYGFLIGSVFSGVVGTGFYPILGSRVWCRFGCPMAAILGVLQKYASRFRIKTNGGQCISCGNCSTYCEMGIDVRWYAQRGEDIKRASCVGCGICSAICPRGVLTLQNTRHST